MSLDAERGNPGDAERETLADGIGESDERFELVEYGRRSPRRSRRCPSATAWSSTCASSRT